MGAYKKEVVRDFIIKKWERVGFINSSGSGVILTGGLLWSNHFKPTATVERIDLLSPRLQPVLLKIATKVLGKYQ